VSLTERMKTKLIRNLGRVHGIGKILLVGEDKQKGIAKLIFVQHALKFVSGFRDTVTIVGIDDEDDTLGVLEICESGGKKGETGQISCKQAREQIPKE